MTAQTERDATHASTLHAETLATQGGSPRLEKAASRAEQTTGEAGPDDVLSGPQGVGVAEAATAAPIDAEDVKPKAETEAKAETPEQERARLLAAAAEAENRCLRARAELDNVQKRHRRDLDQQRAYAASETLREVLPVLDNLDMSLRAADQGVGDPQALLTGIRMIRDQLEQVLLRQGAVRIPTKGKPFDPTIHEAISVIPSDDVKQEMVLEEARVGYRLKDRVLRAAQVIVAKPPARPAEAATAAVDETERAIGDESGPAGENNDAGSVTG